MTELTTTQQKPTPARGRRLAATLALVATIVGVGAVAAPGQASASATGGTGITAQLACRQASNVIDVTVHAVQWSLNPIFVRHRTIVWDIYRRRWVSVAPYSISFLPGSEMRRFAMRLALPDGAYLVGVQFERWDYSTWTPLPVTHDINVWAPNGAVYKAGVCSL